MLAVLLPEQLEKIPLYEGNPDKDVGGGQACRERSSAKQEKTGCDQPQSDKIASRSHCKIQTLSAVSRPGCGAFVLIAANGVRLRNRGLLTWRENTHAIARE